MCQCSGTAGGGAITLCIALVVHTAVIENYCILHPDILNTGLGVGLNRDVDINLGVRVRVLVEAGLVLNRDVDS